MDKIVKKFNGVTKKEALKRLSDVINIIKKQDSDLLYQGLFIGFNSNNVEYFCTKIDKVK